jgi:hypothetical protein
MEEVITRRGFVMVDGSVFYAEALVFMGGQIVSVGRIDADKVRVCRLDGTEICIAEAHEGGNHA